MDPNRPRPLDLYGIALMTKTVNETHKEMYTFTLLAQMYLNSQDMFSVQTASLVLHHGDKSHQRYFP